MGQSQSIKPIDAIREEDTGIIRRVFNALHNNALVDVNMITTSGRTALIALADSKPINMNMFNKLLREKVNVHVRDNSGRTALSYAVYSHNIEAVQALVDAGANVKTIDNRGVASALVASLFHRSMFDMLVAAHAEINVKNDTSGKTALVVFMNVTITPTVLYAIKVLVPKTNINIPDDTGTTALMYIANHRTVDNKTRLEIVNMLMDAGADPLMTRYDGLNVFDYASPMTVTAIFEHMHRRIAAMKKLAMIDASVGKRSVMSAIVSQYS